MCAADPFKNDQNFILSVLSLEELGATGNKGLTGLMTNPVLANGLAGLATSATAQATVEVSHPPLSAIWHPLLPLNVVNFKAECYSSDIEPLLWSAAILAVGDAQPDH